MSEVSSRVLSGPEKAAVLVLAMGSEKSTQLISGLDSREIELLAAEVSRIEEVDEEIRDRVLKEFREKALSEYLGRGGMAFARDLLTQALGEEKAASVMSRLEFSTEGTKLGVEGDAEALRLARLLRDDHPQVSAAVMGQLRPALAAHVLSALPKEKQFDVSLRLVEMDAPDAQAFRRLGEAVRTGLLSEQPAISGPADGTRRLAEILNSADWETERRVLDAINQYDPKLGKQVRDRMFVFDDLVELDSRDLQLVLRNISQEDLRLALHDAGEKLSEHILANMSERAAAALKEDMATAGPVKPKQARAAQQRVAAVARTLAQDGTMVLKQASESEEGEAAAPGDEEDEAEAVETEGGDEDSPVEESVGQGDAGERSAAEG